MPEDIKEDGLYHLYLVRHGRSIGNEYILNAGWTDVPLSASGEKGLLDFRDRMTYPKADRYYYSGLKRAAQTMEILTGVKEAEAKPMWLTSESYYGLAEAYAYLDPVNKEDQLYDYRKFYQGEYQGFGEETFPEFCRRVQYGLTQILQELYRDKAQSAYLFCHYGTIMASLHLYLDKVKVDRLFELEIPNGSLWHLTFQARPEADIVRPAFQCREITVQLPEGTIDMRKQAEFFQ